MMILGISPSPMWLWFGATCQLAASILVCWLAWKLWPEEDPVAEALLRRQARQRQILGALVQPPFPTSRAGRAIQRLRMSRGQRGQ